MINRDLINQYLKDNDITLVGTFSRSYLVVPWLLSLYKMKLPHDKVRLLIYDNTDIENIKEQFFNEFFYLKQIFKSVDYYKSYRKSHKNLIGTYNENFNKSKLKAIFEMWCDLPKLIATDLFILIEDDTLVPPHTFETLLYDFLTLPKAGLVTGIETGRNFFEWSPVRLGVHKLVRKKNKIIKRISLDPNLKGVHEIDCSGVYCFITRKDIYEKALKSMKKYVRYVPFFGMDNILTNNIKLMGYKLYADFSVWCDHVQQSGDRLIKFNKKNAFPMMDLWIPEANNYAKDIIIKNKKNKKIK